MKTCRILTAGPGTQQGLSVIPLLYPHFPDSIKRSFPEVAGSLPEDDMYFPGHFKDASHLIASLNRQALHMIEEGDLASQ